MNFIIQKIKEAIKINKELVRDYELIGVFGGILNSKKNQDIDLVTIGNKKNHNKFLLKLKSLLEKDKFEVNFFKTIKEKPASKHKKHLLIHDLNYTDTNYLLKNEWKSVINSIKRDILILYGENIFRKIVNLSLDGN